MGSFRRTIGATVIAVAALPSIASALTQSTFGHVRDAPNITYNDTVGRTFQNGANFAEQARFGPIFPDPCLWTVGCNSSNPAAGVHLAVPVGAVGDEASASITYSFVVTGPTPISTINVGGMYELMVGNAQSTPANNHELASIFVETSESPDFSSPFIALALGCQNYGTTPYAGCTAATSFSYLQQVHTNVRTYLKIYTLASLDAYGDEALSADAFLDPYIQIDPAFESAHPGFAVNVDDGVSNVGARRRCLGTGAEQHHIDGVRWCSPGCCDPSTSNPGRHDSK